MAKVICVVGILLIGQFVVYYAKHKDDGGGQDGEMANALFSLGGGIVGVILLIAAGLAQLIK